MRRRRLSAWLAIFTVLKPAHDLFGQSALDNLGKSAQLDVAAIRKTIERLRNTRFRYEQNWGIWKTSVPGAGPHGKDAPAIAWYPLAGGHAYPTIIYAPGIARRVGRDRLASFFGEGLSAHGFVFISVEFDSRILLGFNLVHAAERYPRVFDFLERANQDPYSPVFGRMDTSKFIAMGHSAGAGISMRASTGEERISALILMSPFVGEVASGILTLRKPHWDAQGVRCPAMIVAGSRDIPSLNRFNADRLYARLDSPVCYLKVDGMGHFLGKQEHRQIVLQHILAFLKSLD